MVHSATPQTVLRYEVEVLPNGRVELQVPFSPGARLVVLVLEDMIDAYDDLLHAAQSSLDFWDNPYDDEDWNDV